MAFPSPHVIMPAGKHTHTFIMVHGRGSNATEFAEEFFDYSTSANGSLLRQYEASGAKWIFPCAHERMSTAFQEKLCEWFDIFSLSDPSSEENLQIEGLKESVLHIQSIIDDEIGSGIRDRNIILGGISQGYATAIHALLSSKHRLGGFVGMSGWLPFQAHLSVSHSIEAVASFLRSFYYEKLGIAASTNTETLCTSIFLSHSQDDTTIDIELGKSARDALTKLHLPIKWHEYEDGGHWLADPEGYDDLKEFLDSKLS